MRQNTEIEVIKAELEVIYDSLCMDRNKLCYMTIPELEEEYLRLIVK